MLFGYKSSSLVLVALAMAASENSYKAIPAKP